MGAVEAVSLCQSDSQQIAAMQHINMYLCTEAARLRSPAMAHSHDGISVTALPYTFLRKTKMADGHFWVFVACSSAIVYFRMSPPLRHSTVGVLIAVKVSWRFGCAHASSSRRTVINSSLCLYVRMYEYNV